MIPLSVPEIRGNEWKYIKECLDTGWVSSVGSFVDRFEAMVADYVGRRHAVACVNGTSALHMAFLVAGIQPGDEVIVPALTFVAPANAARYAGAWPVFIDVDPDYWQLDPQKLDDFLTKECDHDHGCLINRVTRRVIRAIVPVHLLGHPTDMGPIMALARQFNLLVIEDAAESLGADYQDRKVGKDGDIACLSFNGNKIVTTGGGGMLLTDNEQWAQKAKYLTTQAKDDDVEYIHHEIGYNYRLTNVQAAMGVAQMECLDEYVALKRSMAQRYGQALAGLRGLRLPQEAPWARSTFWLYTILVDERICGVDSRQLIALLRAGGIQTRPLWHPVCRLKAFAGCYAHQVTVAGKLYAQALSLPSSVGLSPQDQEKVVAMIRAHVDKGGRG